MGCGRHPPSKTHEVTEERGDGTHSLWPHTHQEATAKRPRRRPLLYRRRHRPAHHPRRLFPLLTERVCEGRRRCCRRRHCRRHQRCFGYANPPNDGGRLARCPRQGRPRQDASVAEKAGHRITRLRAHRQPVLDAPNVQLHPLHPRGDLGGAVARRVVGANHIEVATIPGRPPVCNDDAEEGEVATAPAGEPDTDHHQGGGGGWRQERVARGKTKSRERRRRGNREGVWDGQGGRAR